MISTRAAIVSLAVLSASCDRASCGSGATPPPPAAPLAMQVELAGCAAVRKGPVCEVPREASELRVWVKAPLDAQLEVAFGGAPLAPTRREIDGGVLLSIPIPAGTATPAPGTKTALTVTAKSGGARGERSVPVERVAMDETLARVEALRTQGKLDDAARAMRSIESFPEPLRGRARSLAARLALAAGRVDEAIAGLQAAMEVHRADGRASDEVKDALALSHTLGSQARRVSDAREVLERVEPALSEWDEGRARMGYYRALVARDAGDVRMALRQFRATEQMTTRLGLDSFLRRSQQASARLLQQLGAGEEALATLRAVEAGLPADASACERAEAMTNRGWVELVMMHRSAPATLRREQHVPSGETLRGSSRPSGSLARTANNQAPHAKGDIARYLAETLAIWERSCPKPSEVANTRTNLALAALEAGDISSASDHVRAARAIGTLPAFVWVWLLDIEARIALRRGDARRALALYDDLATRATAAYEPEARWRATVGRGAALEVMHADSGAERAYRDSEALLDEQSVRVPVNDGRAGFLADRDRSVRLLVDLLVRRGNASGALEAIRTARVRGLRSAQRLDRVAALTPEARRRWEQGLSRYARERQALETESASDWSLPADRLQAVREARRATEEAARTALDDAFAALAEKTDAPTAHEAPREGELLVAFQASADGRKIHALTHDAAGVRANELDALPEDASDGVLAERILGPLEPQIERAHRVRVLSYGPLAAVDLHGLPWRGSPLLAHVPVEYPADLPGTPERAVANGDTRSAALVVADTREDLPSAHSEAVAVSAALAARWDPLRLDGQAATRAAVISGLERADLFHFASHASFDGSRGWDSALHLAQGAYLRAGDVLALPHAPEIVILSGCETGKSAAARVADMSLAHAFIAAGSRMVIAASRPVEDRLAAALVARTYRDAGAAGWDVSESFRAALLDVARSMPETDWRAYRVITR